MKEQALIRLLLFLIAFGLVALGERISPRRALTISRVRRWFANMGILAFNPLMVWLVFPILPVGMALWAEEQGWGLLNTIALPLALEIGIAALVLDLVVYLQHVFFHAVPLLWRLHMVHHADLNIDLTTGVRFHPCEIVLSTGIKLTAVALLGPPLLGVLLFEVLLNATALFNHSNMLIPAGIDRYLRLVIVTPDMHRVHHSVIIRETNSNYGFSLPWWDRLLGTYKPQPEKGHTDMTIGLAQFRDQGRLGLGRLLVMPFVEGPGSVPINRH